MLKRLMNQWQLLFKDLDRTNRIKKCGNATRIDITLNQLRMHQQEVDTTRVNVILLGPLSPAVNIKLQVCCNEASSLSCVNRVNQILTIIRIRSEDSKIFLI